MTDPIEAMARAMRPALFSKPDPVGPITEYKRRICLEMATAARDAHLAALSETHLIETQAERQSAIDAAEARGHARGVAEERERAAQLRIAFLETREMLGLVEQVICNECCPTTWVTAKGQPHCKLHDDIREVLFKHEAARDAADVRDWMPAGDDAGELLPCPFCGVHLIERDNGLFHPESDGQLDCPLGGMSWCSDYYRAAWDTRVPQGQVIAKARGE